jgi:hypothetical protein
LSNISSLTTLALKAKASSAGSKSLAACVGTNADNSNKNKGNNKRFKSLSQVFQTQKNLLITVRVKALL